MCFFPIGNRYTLVCVCKTLLGVRQTKANILCLLETCYPELKGLVKRRCASFIHKFVHSASGEEPLSAAMTMCRRFNSPGIRILDALLRERRDAVVKNIDELRCKCSELRPSSTKVNTYCTLNCCARHI